MPNSGNRKLENFCIWIPARVDYRELQVKSYKKITFRLVSDTPINWHRVILNLKLCKYCNRIPPFVAIKGNTGSSVTICLYL